MGRGLNNYKDDISLRPSTDRSEGFPARDIWFLGVILPGLDQMQRVLGTSPPPPSPPPPSPPSLVWVWVWVYGIWVWDWVYGIGFGFVWVWDWVYRLWVGFGLGYFQYLNNSRVLKMIDFQCIALKVLKIGLFPVSQQFQGPYSKLCSIFWNISK